MQYMLQEYEYTLHGLVSYDAKIFFIQVTYTVVIKNNAFGVKLYTTGTHRSLNMLIYEALDYNS